MKILVVEDEPFVALAVAWELQQAGHEVIGPVAHASEAFALCSRECPELALIDIDEGYRHEGLALAQFLQERSSVPSLYLTSDPQLARVHSDAAVGAIAKPFDPQDLVRSVDVARAILGGGEPDPGDVPRSMEVFH